MLLGITIGSAFSNSNPSVVLATMLASSFALGISTGISVFESESMERERRIADLEKALFRDLDETKIEASAKFAVRIISIVNFLTPLVSCGIISFPFVLVQVKVLDMRLAPWASVALALSAIFVAGIYLGREGKKNPWIKGLEMVAFGALAFLIGVFIEAVV